MMREFVKSFVYGWWTIIRGFNENLFVTDMENKREEILIILMDLNIFNRQRGTRSF